LAQEKTENLLELNYSRDHVEVDKEIKRISIAGTKCSYLAKEYAGGRS
jgi:hypothetical protein